jgi:glycosyltransferase involved in cell wall biosynthesis
MMLIRAPTPLLPLFAWIWKKPVALLLVSDQLEGIENLPQPPWRKTLIRWWATWGHSKQMQLSNRSLVFVNSRLLYEKYQADIPNLIQTQTTTLSEEDFYSREDTCMSMPYHLLYAGRMTRIKGLFEIVKALANLVDDGFDVVLDLVGMIDSGDPVLDSVVDFARSLGVEEMVQYHGYKTAGPELLAYYRRADIYVIASQSSSEGFPRTIWEAMASSTPVVATQVGSIPAFIGDAALLVPPKDVDALTGAIKTLLTDNEMRKVFIQRGLALAKENTLEKRTGELIIQMETRLSGEHL